MSGWAFLAIATLICAGVFANGVRFRRSDDRLAARLRLPVEQLRRIGGLFIVAAPLAWLLFAALCFGLLGRIKGISTIQLVSGSGS